MPTLETVPANVSYLQPTTQIDLADAFSRYANPHEAYGRPITLVRPPVYFSRNSFTTPIALPIGVAYLASTLRSARYDVRIIDCVGLDIQNIRLAAGGRVQMQGLDEDQSVAAIPPTTDIIGVSIMFSQEWPFVRDYIGKIRAAFPDATIVVGGEHITAMPDYSLRDCPAIDYAVTGEGELAFLELVYRLRRGEPVLGVGGVAYRDATGEVALTGLAPRIADIEKIPWPAWDLVDLEGYFQPNYTMGIAHGRNMAMVATRGCPFQCTFCSNPTMWTTRYTMRDVKDVVDEIAFDIRTYRANAIDFYDLTAIVKKQWILDLIAELERRRIHVAWQLPSGTRSESLDAEVVEGLARTGCGLLVYAPESGSQRTLEMIKKRVNLRNMQRSLRASVRCGIVAKVNFIIGFPFEHRRDMWATLFFMWKLALTKVDDCIISTFSPYPGSELFRELEHEGAFNKIDDAFFDTLMTQVDFTVPKTYCRHVGPREIKLYVMLGMALFYLLSYVRMPGRLLRLIKMLCAKDAATPHTLFEQRVLDYKARWLQVRAGSVGARVGNNGRDGSGSLQDVPSGKAAQGPGG